MAQVDLPRLRPGQVQLPEHLTCQSPPELLRENYKGYNIVHYLDQYYALAQRLGPVDLTRMETKETGGNPGFRFMCHREVPGRDECRIDHGGPRGDAGRVSF